MPSVYQLTRNVAVVSMNAAPPAVAPDEGSTRKSDAVERLLEVACGCL